MYDASWHARGGTHPSHPRADNCAFLLGRIASFRFRSRVCAYACARKGASYGGGAGDLFLILRASNWSDGDIESISKGVTDCKISGKYGRALTALVIDK